MKTVIQRGRRDCGVACVAMLANVEYERAYAALYGWDRPWAADIVAMKRALKRLGVKSAKRRKSVFGMPERYLSDKFDALIFTNYRKSVDEGHWIVWDSRNQEYRDPLKRPYKNPKVHSFLVIER